MAIINNLRYAMATTALLKQSYKTIKIIYEDLCKSDFQHKKLDQFFQRHIALKKSKKDHPLSVKVMYKLFRF